MPQFSQKAAQLSSCMLCMNHIGKEETSTRTRFVWETLHLMASLEKKEDRSEKKRQEKSRHVHQTSKLFVLLESKTEQVCRASQHESVQLWSQPYL